MALHFGCVQVTNNDLAAKCEKCRKAMAYQIGSGMTLSRFNKLLREFVLLHNANCGRNAEPTSKESENQ